MIEDGDDGLAVWLETGTPMLSAVPADGLPLRDHPLAERFALPHVYEVRPWHGAGIVMLERPGGAHSVWLFRRPPLGGEEVGAFWGWYGNLEAPLQRTSRGVQTIDHILDVWMEPAPPLGAGSVHWKDEDELEAAVAVGRFGSETAAEIRAEGELVHAAMTRRDPPFDGAAGGWLDWRPDPAWTRPALPEAVAALAGRATEGTNATISDLICADPGPASRARHAR